jgi:hypothetical protein
MANILSVRLSPKLTAELHTRAAGSNQTVSQYVRACLISKAPAPRLNPLIPHDMARLACLLDSEGFPHLADELRAIMIQLQ